MLRNSAILIFILVCTSVYSYAQKSDTKKTDEATIREIVKQVEAGWNTKSGKDFAAPFAEDADYVVVNGMYIKGKEAIEKGHQQIFDTVYKDSQLAGTVKSLRFLRSDVAVVHVEWNMVYRYQDKENKSTAINTLLMTKENGTWKIAAFHNTSIQTEKR